MRTLTCFAEGRDGDWEALCLDLDIAVQGQTFEEVYESLNKAICFHLESVRELPVGDREHLLYRSAPLHVWLGFVRRFLVPTLFRRPRNGGPKLRHGFTTACPA